MKFIYILGLEHSGTTLTDSLLSKLPNAIGLGEISSFFSPQHMQAYMLKWHDCHDVRLCSCLADWSDCVFWSEIEYLNGINSKLEIIQKYRLLFDYLGSKYSNDVILIDSSKSLVTLKKVVEDSTIHTKVDSDINVVYSLKSPQEFAMSILRKKSNVSLLTVFHAFNWWYGANKEMLEYCEDNRELVTLSTYQELCSKPSTLIRNIASKLAIANQQQKLLSYRSNSHIAMGNKNFVIRNSDHIRYDGEWRGVWQIRLVSLFHYRARLLYRKIKLTLV